MADPSAQQEPVRVVVADDHAVFSAGLAALLDAEPGIVVVGRAGTGGEAVALAEELQPDVLVLDLGLPDRHGVEVARDIVTTSPRVGVLVLTMYADDAVVFQAVQAGARGYLLKESGPDDVVGAVRAVARGDAIFGPGLAERLIGWFTAASGRAGGPFGDLTGRERQVLELVAGGLGNQAIAERLGIKPKTVRNLVSNVLLKLQVADRAAAMIRAREAGFGGAHGTGGR